MKSRVYLSLVPALVAAASFAQAAQEPPAEVLAAESARIAVMAKAKNAVLAIFDAAGQGGGSGVVITADGYALSNFHVAQPCGNAMKCGMADGRVYDAVVVGLDPTGDVALVKVLGRNDFPHAELADSDQLRVGDPVFAMGNPFLLATDFQPTVTSGMISGTHRYQFPDGTLLEYTDCLQTDASINPGNSGGPLFDSQGRVVGINGRCSFDKRGRVSVDVGYAISINQIKHFLGYLHSGRIVDHATLGARVVGDDQGRVLVSDLLETSDAFRRGLRADDEIISFGGRPISTPNGFKNVLGIFPKGWRVPLTYRRDGKRVDCIVRLAGLHGTEQLIEKTLGRPVQPGPKPGDLPRGRTPPKPRNEPPKAPMPDEVKKVFQEKHGFANYFFNKQEQQRILKLWKPPGGEKTAHGPWTIGSKLASGAATRFRITDADVVLEAPAENSKWTATNNFSESLVPIGSNGLLPALFLWRKLAVEGLDAFTDSQYLGTVPLPQQEGLFDVLVGSFRGVDAWFYFDAHGQMVAMEMYGEEHSDPCEIYFSRYRDAKGHDLPGRMEVHAGDAVFNIFNLDQFDFEKAGK